MTTNQLRLPTVNSNEISGMFRPIHYLGSKLRMVGFIENVMNSIDPEMGPVCDLFAGSGSVAFKLSYSRSIRANDIQEYSRVLCTSLLNLAEYPDSIDEFITTCRNSKHMEMISRVVEPIAEYESICIEKAIKGDEESLCELLEKGSLISYEKERCHKYSKELDLALYQTNLRMEQEKLTTNRGAIALRFFGGLYFSYIQSAYIDVLLENIFEINEMYRDGLLAPLLSTASDVVNTVGKHFAQPIRPRNKDGTAKQNLANRVIKDRKLNVLSIYENWLEKYTSINNQSNNHKVYKLDYLEALDKLDDDVKIIYADPPYTRDHYSRFYHVLETFCIYDNPEISMTKRNGKIRMSRGIYRKDRHQSPFCIRSQAPIAFDNLFSKARNREISIVLSYSPYNKERKARPRVLTIEQIINIAKKYYKKIEIISPGKFSHSKLNRSDKNFEKSYDAEKLLIFEIN